MMTPMVKKIVQWVIWSDPFLMAYLLALEQERRIALLSWMADPELQRRTFAGIDMLCFTGAHHAE